MTRKLATLATTALALGLLGLIALPDASADHHAKDKAKEAPAKEKPAYEKSRDLGVAAPKDADILFDGTQESIDKNWVMWPKKDMDITWKLVDSPTDDTKVLQTNGGKKWGTHDLVTKKKYQDYEGHVEFNMMGKRGDDSAEGYANSGVYMQNRYEIQIESPPGKWAQKPREWKIGPHGIGAFCMDRVPDHNAWRDPGTWQSFHFIFKAARFDDAGKKTASARATVWWNGILIHDDIEVNKANGGIKVTPEPGGLKLQEHGQDVRYRNVWIKEIK